MNNLILIIVASLIASGIFLYCQNRRISEGYETNPSNQAAFLGQILEREIQFTGLQEDWLDSSWAVGFKDHTYLYKLTIPQEHLARFENSFSGNSSEYLEDYFRSGDYLGSAIAPDWWDAEYLDSSNFIVNIGDSVVLRLNIQNDSVYLIVVTL